MEISVAARMRSCSAERKGTMAQCLSNLLAALPADLTLALRGKDKPQKRKGLCGRASTGKKRSTNI